MKVEEVLSRLMYKPLQGTEETVWHELALIIEEISEVEV